MDITFQDRSVLRIIQDESAESPREHDNNGQMVCFHKKYDLGDKHGYDAKDFERRGWDRLQAQIEKDCDVVVILPLYLYDHSGLTMNTTGFNCSWDSMQVGFIFATRENLKRGGHPDNVDPDKVKKWLVGEVRTYDRHLKGDVWGFQLYAPPCDKCGGKGKVTDSCWGFYGDDPRKNGMMDNLDTKYREELLAGVVG